MKVDPNSNPTHTLYSGLPLSSESPRPYHTIPYYSFYSNPLHSILFLHYITMTISPSSLSFLAVLAVFSLLFAASVHAQAPAPAPTSDGTSIDQGIAYVLMLVALVLTYLIHPLDASSYSFF